MRKFIPLFLMAMWYVQLVYDPETDKYNWLAWDEKTRVILVSEKQFSVRPVAVSHWKKYAERKKIDDYQLLDVPIKKIWGRSDETD